MLINILNWEYVRYKRNVLQSLGIGGILRYKKMNHDDMLRLDKYKGDQINFELKGMKGIPSSIVNRGYKGYINYMVKY